MHASVKIYLQIQAYDPNPTDDEETCLCYKRDSHRKYGKECQPNCYQTETAWLNLTEGVEGLSDYKITLKQKLHIYNSLSVLFFSNST